MFLFSISPAHAEDIDFSVIPQNLADKMGIPLFAGQLLCSTIILLIFVLPTALIARKKNASPIAELMLGLCIMGFCLALGWLPYWILLILVMLVAFMYADKIAGKISNRGSD